MNRLVLGWLLCFFSYSMYGQLPLDFKSYYIRLKVAKDSALILVTKAGEVGIKRGANYDWSRRDPRVGETSGITLEQANFFNKDTGFVSGFIHNDKSGNYDVKSSYNIVYHTTDGGKNWNRLKFGIGGWVDAAVSLDNGEAWLSVSGGDIAYSADFGFHWIKLPIPDNKRRFSSLFFNERHEGLIGSLSNYLAYTNNNCDSWKVLPTPLDQKKYLKTNVDSRPEVNKVAIFKNLFLIRQEELVFYSRKDSIDWICLPDVANFYTDAENTGLYFQTNNGEVGPVNDRFLSGFHFKIDDKIFDAEYKNKSLYIITQRKVLQVNPDSTVIDYSLTRKDSVPVEPQIIGFASGGMFGMKDNKIFKNFDGSLKKWDFEFTFPYPLDSGTLSLHNDRFLYSRADTLYYLTTTGEVLTKTPKYSFITRFEKEGIRSIVFKTGSRGCFHNDEDRLVYELRNGVYYNSIKESEEGAKILLPENNNEIDKVVVDAFISKLNQMYDTSAFTSVSDLMFSESDYVQCKKDIQRFQERVTSGIRNLDKGFYFNRNNLDFERLITLVDSVKMVQPQVLRNILFQLEGGWSTTTNWTGVDFINNQQQVLSITSFYYRPNFYYFPWTVSLEGYSTMTVNVEINKFLNQVFPEMLKRADKMEVLYAIVKHLY